MKTKAPESPLQGLQAVFPYRVVWTIDVHADSPLEAAKAARRIQLDPHSVATFFNVTHRGSDTTIPIDLEDHPE